MDQVSLQGATNTMDSAPLSPEVQKDEVFVLMSIYSGESEIKLNSPGSLTELERWSGSSDTHPISLTVRMAVGHSTARPVEISTTFTLPRAYPAEPPVIGLLSEGLPVRILLTLQQKAETFAESLRPDPSMYSVLCWLRDEVGELLARDASCAPIGSEENRTNLGQPRPPTEGTSATREGPTCSGEATISVARRHPLGDLQDNLTVCIAKIDHMRREHKYMKVLNSWARDLTVSGKVISCGQSRIYVIIVSPCTGNLKEFVRRWKTQNVDVDAQGRPCKEKLINILCLQPLLSEAPRQCLR